MENKKPVANVRISLEIEVFYDSFQGRTLAEFGDLLDQEMHECLNDFRLEDVVSICSKVESVDLINEK